jgi:outer membrane protein assembly factor BamB
MQKYRLLIKGLVLGIMVLFIGAVFVTTISGNIKEPRRVNGHESGIMDDLDQARNELSYSLKSIDWWPMFRHDVQHTGYSTSTAPNTNNVRWRYRTGGVVGSSPAVYDGRLYVGSRDRNVYCLNATYGTKIWNFSTDGYVDSSPVVADGRVYIGSGACCGGWDNKLHCLDAYDGEHIWTFTAGSCVESSPTVVDGCVYVGSWDKNVYCLYASNGSVKWSYLTGDDVYSSPAVVAGCVYIGSHDGNVYCLDAETGAKLWNYTTGDWVHSSPAVVDGMVFVGSYDGDVYCLYASNGSKKWNTTIGDWVYSSPAVAYGKVYVGSVWGEEYPDYEGVINCLDAETGDPIWDFPATYHVKSSPAVADGKVYIGTQARVKCLDADDGHEIWSYSVSGYIQSSPAVVNGWVYIGIWTSQGDNVYCFGASVANYPPETPSQPSGPTEGDVGVEYLFSTSTVDPDGDRVQYGWDWDGDHVVDEWTSLYDSGIPVETPHTWINSGDFEISVKARDQYNAESSYSEPWLIHITDEGGEMNHTVFAEYGTETTCEPCVVASNQLYNIYTSGDYNFSYVSLVADMNTKAAQRCSDLGIIGYPDVYFDGTFTHVAGGHASDLPYRNAIETCSARPSADISLEVEMIWQADAVFKIVTTVHNNDSAEYSGLVRTYIVEPVSRWFDYSGNPYHYAILDLLVDPLFVPDTTKLTQIWDGNQIGYGDISKDNIMVIITVFDNDTEYADETSSATPVVQCGDCNGDGVIDLGDVVYLINYLFRGGPAPLPELCAGDCNDDGTVDLGDVVLLINYLFRGGSAPGGCCE